MGIAAIRNVDQVAVNLGFVETFVAWGRLFRFAGVYLLPFSSFARVYFAALWLRASFNFALFACGYLWSFMHLREF